MLLRFVLPRIIVALSVAKCDNRTPTDKRVTVLIRGRVVNAEGQPADGAHVLLDRSGAPEPPFGELHTSGGTRPFVAVADAEGEYTFTDDTHPYLDEMLGKLKADPLVGQHSLSVRAIRGQQASETTAFDWEEEVVALPDLVLESGAIGRVLVRWDDGTVGSGVLIDVFLDDQHTDRDERARLMVFRGTTDEQGEFTFGPVLDREFRVIVRASHADGPPRMKWWDSRISDPKCFRLTLPRGRSIRGRLMTAKGHPAVGYRVAPWEPDTGDPESGRVVCTDSRGYFTVASVNPRQAAIAVYDKASAPTEHSTEVPNLTWRPVNPLLIREVSAASDDLGDVWLPRLGTLSVHVEDRMGRSAVSARAQWWHSNSRHGSRVFSSDDNGIVRLERVPLGIAIDMHVSVRDWQYGRLQQRFAIADVKEERVNLRVTGAGTVVIRLHLRGSPREPLVVDRAVAQWSENHSLASAAKPTSELRGWTSPGLYPVLSIQAKGLREHTIEDVEVSSEGPTIVDVELDPR
jgi:hypothetical protein